MATVFQFTTDLLLANINEAAQFNDLCWPYKGEDNILLRGSITEQIYLDTKLHTPNYNNSLNWLDSKPILNYKSELNELVINVDVSTLNHNSLVKNYQFTNNASKEVSLAVFVITQPDFLANYSRDTAIFYPQIQGIVHYEKDIYFAVYANKKWSAYSCQDPQDYAGRGARPDNSLNLSLNPVTTGRVESCLKYDLIIPAGETKELNLYFSFASSYKKVLAEYYSNLAAKVIHSKNNLPLEPQVKALAQITGLTEGESTKLQILFSSSKYLVAGSYTAAGGIFAAIDSKYFKAGGVDDYSYFWPRDGALVFLSEVLNSNETELQKNKEKYLDFFNYISKCYGDDNYLMHKFRLDDKASLGSSWHSWVDFKGNFRQPLQLDETALSIFAYGKYIRRVKILVSNLNYKLIGIAEFLLAQVTDDGLHVPCFDVWENHWGIFFATQLSLIAAFKELSYIFNNYYHQPELVIRLELITTKAIKALNSIFVTPEKTFFRGFIIDEYGNRTKDYRADATINWAWYLQVLSPDNDIIKNTIMLDSEKLLLNSGWGRYEDDNYLRISKDGKSNPWYISTIWYTRYFLLTNNLEKAKDSLRFILNHMEPTGLLPEMAHPYSGFALSQEPLIWSQAEVLNLLNWDKKF